MKNAGLSVARPERSGMRGDLAMVRRIGCSRRIPLHSMRGYGSFHRDDGENFSIFFDNVPVLF